MITQLTRRLDHRDIAAAERVSGIITTGFEAGDLPSSVVNQLREGYAAIGVRPGRGPVLGNRGGSPYRLVRRAAGELPGHR